MHDSQIKKFIASISGTVSGSGEAAAKLRCCVVSNITIAIKKKCVQHIKKTNLDIHRRPYVQQHYGGQLMCGRYSIPFLASTGRNAQT